MPPAPRENPLLLGHEAAEQVIIDAIGDGRLHHAWLIAGPQGIGKATLAFRFARALMARSRGTLELDPALPVFRRVATRAHADLLTLERPVDTKTGKLKAEIPVDTIRTVAPFLHLTPAEGGWRVVVVDGAEHMNRNAANALLKLLEEPPVRAILLLTCATPGRLLPTLRSRCRALRLDRLDDRVVADLLGRYRPETSSGDIADLVRLAEGSIGRALLLADEDGVRLSGMVGRLLAVAPRVPALQMHDVADALGQAEKEGAAYSTFMDLLRTALAAAVRATAAGHPDPAQLRLASARPLAEWGEVWHALTRMQDETERANLDKRVATVLGLNLLNGP